MASAVASLVLGRAVCRSFPSLTPMCRPRCLSRLTSSCVSLMGLISRTPVRPCPAISVRHASSSTSKAVSPEDMIKRADKNRLNVLENEIKRADGSWATQQEVTFPEDFPFEIVDKPTYELMLLKREFQGESVEVQVFTVVDLNDYEDEVDEDDHVRFWVKINKGDGPYLKLCGRMDSDCLTITDMILIRTGYLMSCSSQPALSSEEDLQSVLCNYLAVRGIKPSLYDFLCNYLLNNQGRVFRIGLWNQTGFDMDLQRALNSYLVVRGLKPSLYDFFLDCLLNVGYVIRLKKLTGFVANGVPRETCSMCMSKNNHPAKY